MVLRIGRALEIALKSAISTEAVISSGANPGFLTRDRRGSNQAGPGILVRGVGFAPNLLRGKRGVLPLDEPRG